MALRICLSNLRNLSPSLIPELASGNLAIHPAFVLGRTLVSCSLAWQQGRQSHCAASQNIDDKLSEKTCPLVASVRSPSKHIEHPHQESGASQGITGDSGGSSEIWSGAAGLEESNSQQETTND